MSLALDDRIEAFSRLGEIMLDACSDNPHSIDGRKLREIAESQAKKNRWFTSYNVLKSINVLAKGLNDTKLRKWLDIYRIPEINHNPKSVGVILAGNIPLVGFHDLLSVLLTGNVFIGKTSSKDRDLICEIQAILLKIEPLFKDYIFLTNDKINIHDAVIATGSNNSSRFFEYTYGNKPHIFRKNRNSVAIINSGTRDQDLLKLGEDVFDYFGLGCRNVSKLYLPESFDFNRLNKAWNKYSVNLETYSYLNNYNYNKALYTVESSAFLDLNYVLLKEDAGFSSPVAVLYYSFYDSMEDVKAELLFNSDKIQTIVGEGYIPFGQVQAPALNDYADGIDTIEFILNL